jgi:phosphoglycolate phosphatase
LKIPGTDLVAIFDLDGTLTDSVSQIGENLNRAREELNFVRLPDSFYKKNVGLPIDYLIADLELDDQIKSKLIHKFRGHLIADIRLGNNKVFHGVSKMLEIFASNGVNLAIATSKPSQVAMAVYQFSVLREFPLTIQGTDGFPPKPNPEVIIRVLHNYSNAKALMVGDRSEDMVAARAANITGIGIAAGAHSRQALLDGGASIVFHNISEFAAHLEQNFGQIRGFFR